MPTTTQTTTDLLNEIQSLKARIAILDAKMQIWFDRKAEWLAELQRAEREASARCTCESDGPCQVCR